MLSKILDKGVDRALTPVTFMFRVLLHLIFMLLKSTEIVSHWSQVW